MIVLGTVDCLSCVNSSTVLLIVFDVSFQLKAQHIINKEKL